MEPLPQYQTYDIPVSDIFVDPDFNSRGDFTLESLKSLADSIKENGLKFPIVVQPWDSLTNKFKYRLVAGHRRLRAMVAHLKATTIPAMVVSDLDEHAAKRLNLLENIQRQDLNMLEEARAIRQLYPKASNREIADAIQMSRGWVNARIHLLELPEQIQSYAATGLLKLSDIEALASMKVPNHRKIAAAERVIFSRKHSKTRRPRVGGLDYKAPIKVRAKNAINKLVAEMLDAGITGLAPRVGAWCAGEISMEEIKEDIRKHLGIQNGTLAAEVAEEQ